MAFSPEADDLQLLADARRGERGALEAFVRRHDRWVRHVVYATLGTASAVDDVAQHVWATVTQQIGTLADPQRWRGWLYRLARNAAIDAGVKASRDRRRRDSLPDGGEVPGTEAEPWQSLVAADEHRRVLQAIHGLPDIYREPFILRHVEDWSYAQIAEAMSLPVDTVETRLVRARRLLRTALKDLAADRESPPTAASERRR